MQDDREASKSPGEADRQRRTSGPALLDQATARLSGLQAALAIQPEDPWYVGGAKILGMIVVGALLVALSPLIVLGLIAGFAAAA